MLMSQFLSTSNSKRYVLFIVQLLTISADWDGLRDHLRGISWKGISEPGASVVAAAFHERIHVEIYVHIPHRKYQVVSLIYPSGFKLLVLL